MPVDYQLAKIYKIIPLNQDDESDIYIGSTCKPSLLQRMTGHIRHFKSWKNGKYNNVSSFKLFDKYGIENLNIYLIEEFPCDCKDQLRQREGYYIKNNPCVNQRIAGRTKKEYYINNIDHIKEYKGHKLYCICGCCYNKSNKARHYKTLKHINYMTKHDDIMTKVNDLMISIIQIKPICSINYSNI